MAKGAEIRQSRLNQDEKDIILLKENFYKKNQKVGALQIKMFLENDKNVVMNHKKIRRLMRIYGLVAKVKRTNPYKKMAKASQEHRIVPNLLKRVFNQEEPGKVLLTDITYLYLRDEKLHLSHLPLVQVQKMVVVNHAKNYLSFQTQILSLWIQLQTLGQKI